MNKTKLTVAKICHEIANCLSILKFIQEDLEDISQPRIKEMMRTIDFLSATLDFFRNIYSVKIDANSVQIALNKIYLLKGLNLIDSGKLMSVIPDNLKNAINGILYIVMKISKEGDNVDLSGDHSEIILKLPQDRFFAKGVLTALTENIVEDDIFNIFVNYAKYLANLDNYQITTAVVNGGQMVKLYKIKQ